LANVLVTLFHLTEFSLYETTKSFVAVETNKLETLLPGICTKSLREMPMREKQYLN
jgi:hypothetical protein